MKKLTELIQKEMKGCFDFFWETTNHDPSSPGYGLVLDSSKKPDVATIAGVGFALAAYIIGVERKYITFQEGYDRCLGTLKSIQANVDKFHGFYIHFLDIRTGENHGLNQGRPSEYSTIDTAILLMGVLAAGEYFQKEVAEIGMKMIEEADWEFLIDPDYSRPQFRMAYNPATGGWGKAKWNHYAEQLMMYFLYAGKKDADPELARKLYFGFDRNVGSYKGENYVYCHTNALFIHQFTHAFIDFSRLLDPKGFDWFQNSVHATLANQRWCLDQTWSNTFQKGFWGLTASHSKKGYSVAGGPPWGFDKIGYVPSSIDGTVAPYAPLSSIIFTPDISLQQLELYANEESLWGKYGLYDSFNFESGSWVSQSYLAIDKGPTIIMLDNYLFQTIHKLLWKSPFIQKAISVLAFREKDDWSLFQYEGGNK